MIYERVYYYCGACQSGRFPTDEEFGLEHKQTAAAREAITLGGLLQPFAETAENVLSRLSGLRVSAATVRRTTEAVGADVADRRAAGEVFGDAACWKWQADAQGRRVAYVSLDATGVQQQGPQGRKAEGRMPWIGAVFNPQPVHPARKSRKSRRRQRRLKEVRYVSGLLSLPEIGAQLRRECAAAGVARADVVIALTDGGNGLEDCLLTALGGLSRHTRFILDFYHVTEHLREFAKLWLAEDAARQKCVRAWSDLLKRAGGAALLRQLQTLDLSRASPAVQESHRQLCGYLQKNLHRTDYPDYLAQGWQIGSGVIEAACKTVIGRRMKCSGMRWGERHTTPMCQLRALYRSSPNLWADYWNRSTRKTHQQI